MVENASRSPGDGRRISRVGGPNEGAERRVACDEVHMQVRVMTGVMSVLQVPIVAHRPTHPGGYAGLPVEVYRIWSVLANIERCCGHVTSILDDPQGLVPPGNFLLAD
jgi:hypothetical protein